MPKDNGKVRVALNGSIIIAPVSTPDPTSFDELYNLPKVNPLVKDLGFTTEDGIEFSFGREAESLMGWQSKNPLRRLVTETPSSSSYTLRQMDRDTWTTTMGGSTRQLAGGLYIWEPDDGVIPEYKVFQTFKDGEIHYCFGFRRAQQTAEVSFNFQRTDSVNLNNEWTVMEASDTEKPWFVMTNDPAFGESGAYPAWKATTAYTVGTRTKLASGQVLEATVAGTSAATAPTAPAAVGGTVVDGTTTWKRVS